MTLAAELITSSLGVANPDVRTDDIQRRGCFTALGARGEDKIVYLLLIIWIRGFGLMHGLHLHVHANTIVYTTCTYLRFEKWVMMILTSLVPTLSTLFILQATKAVRRPGNEARY